MSDFQAVFDRIRPMFAAHEPRCVVPRDGPQGYILGSQEVRGKDGYRTWFGGVEIKKNYVSAHLFPVYMHPEMPDDRSGAEEADAGQVMLQLQAAGRSGARHLRRAGPQASAARFVKDGRL